VVVVGVLGWGERGGGMGGVREEYYFDLVFIGATRSRTTRSNGTSIVLR
jgi:hypothetical protein